MDTSRMAETELRRPRAAAMDARVRHNVAGSLDGPPRGQVLVEGDEAEWRLWTGRYIHRDRLGQLDTTTEDVMQAWLTAR